jgi:hypothetical protein
VVSGSLSLPSRGAFHRSLTVLSAIGRLWYLALGGGPPRFSRDFPCPDLLRIPRQRPRRSPTGLSPSPAPSSNGLRLGASRPVDGSCAPSRGPQPRRCNAAPLPQRRFGLFPGRSPLLGECSLFLEVLRCFSSLGAPPRPASLGCRCMTTGRLPHSDIPGSPLARQLPRASRSHATSFLGHKRLGIHHSPFLPHSLTG